jgi:hypothetical protein
MNKQVKKFQAGIVTTKELKRSRLKRREEYSFDFFFNGFIIDNTPVFML